MVMLDCACHSGGAYQSACSIPGGCGSEGCDCSAPSARDNRVRLAMARVAASPLPAADGTTTPDDRCAVCDKPGLHEHCLLCSRRDPRPTRVCQNCRDRSDANLTDLPEMVRRLELELLPTQGIGERVASSSPHSAPAARLAAMNLRVSSAVLDAGHPWWYQPPGDLLDPFACVGMPSIPSWVRLWAREWRTRHGHHTSNTAARTRAEADEMAALRRYRPVQPLPPEAPTLDPADPGGQEAWDAHGAAVLRWGADMNQWGRDLQGWRQEVAETVRRGQRVMLGTGAALPHKERPGDPVAEQWTTRHGTAAEHHALTRDAEYLGTWLGTAYDDADLHEDIGEFLHGLRMLHKAATVVLEGRPVDRYCGRCPEVRFDRETGSEEVCGTNLWSEGFASIIICPRCKSETRRSDFLHLRAMQLDRWSESELATPSRGVA